MCAFIVSSGASWDVLIGFKVKCSNVNVAALTSLLTV